MKIFLSRTLLLILSVHVTTTWNRRLFSAADDDDDDSYSFNDVEEDENTLERFQDEIENIEEQLYDIKDTIDERNGDEEMKHRHLHHDEIRNKVLSSKRESEDNIKAKAYADYLEKISRVSTVEDFKREFNVHDNDNFKREDIPFAGNPPSCAPKDQAQPVNFTSATEFIYPPCVTVKRCGGCCRTDKNCIATTTAKRQSNVRRIAQVGSSFMVVGVHTVNYEDDVTCQCQCKKQPTDCNANQTFNAITCQCKCNTKAKECANEKKQWSANDCGCICINKNPSCDLNHVWNSETCHCDQVVLPTCPTGRSLYSATCLCKEN